MLPRNLHQEAFSRAYVHAVAAKAGLIFTLPGADIGIDVCLHTVTARGRCYGPGTAQLDLQVKSTTRPIFRDGQLLYDLEVKNYDDLRVPDPLCPRMLVVVVLPAEESQWLSQSPEELTLRRCAYWLGLAGAEPTDSTTTRRVALPLTNLFAVPALQEMVSRLERGEPPC
jgi:hypothetical protein